MCVYAHKPKKSKNYTWHLKGYKKFQNYIVAPRNAKTKKEKPHKIAGTYSLYGKVSHDNDDDNSNNGEDHVRS